MHTIRQFLALGALFLAVVLLVGVTSATADPIQTFNATTTGTFSGSGASGNTITRPGTGSAAGTSSTITFTSANPELVATLAPGQSANITLGIFQANSATPSGTVAGAPNFSGATFTLTVNFTVPSDASPNPVTFTGTLSGTIVQGASSTSVQWLSPTTLSFTSPTAGSFTLTVESLTPVNTPIDPNETRIRAVLTYTSGPVSGVVPEPTTLILLGGGLLSLAGASGWRGRRKVKSMNQE